MLGKCQLRKSVYKRLIENKVERGEGIWYIQKENS